jgi:type I restriction enzyme, S subunit
MDEASGTTGKWKPYPEYKNSDVEWLGDVPGHWEIKPLKFVSRCLDGRRIPLNAEERFGMQGDFPYWGANCIVDHVERWLFDENLVLLGEDGAPFFDRTKDVSFFGRG